MRSIRVILKSGQDFIVKCDDFTIIKNDFGRVEEYKIEEAVENYPLYLDFSQVAAIVWVISDEPACVVPELSIAGC